MTDCDTNMNESIFNVKSKWFELTSISADDEGAQKFYNMKQKIDDLRVKIDKLDSIQNLKSNLESEEYSLSTKNISADRLLYKMPAEPTEKNFLLEEFGKQYFEFEKLEKTLLINQIKLEIEAQEKALLNCFFYNDKLFNDFYHNQNEYSKKKINFWSVANHEMPEYKYKYLLENVIETFDKKPFTRNYLYKELIKLKPVTTEDLNELSIQLCELDGTLLGDILDRYMRSHKLF